MCVVGTQTSKEQFRRRRDYDGICFAGSDASADILPHLNLTIELLRKVSDTLGRKPILDVGSCASTLPCELELNGIGCTPLDIRYAFTSKEEYLHYVTHSYRSNFSQDKNIPIPQKVMKIWERLWDKALGCDASQIAAKDLSHSISLAHCSVPKHSPDFDTFINSQLPEIARVTAGAIIVFPLARFVVSADKKRLNEQESIYNDPTLLRQVIEKAQALGFVAFLATPQPSPEDKLLNVTHPRDSSCLLLRESCFIENPTILPLLLTGWTPARDRIAMHPLEPRLRNLVVP